MSIFRFEQKENGPLPCELMEAYSNHTPIDLSLYEMKFLPNPVTCLKAEFIKHILTYGVHSLTNGRLDEAVINRNMTSSDIEDILGLFLNEIFDSTKTDQELVIVDSYLFKSNRHMNALDVASRIISILRPFAAKIKHVIVITTTNYEIGIKNQVETGLNAINSSLTLDVKFSNDYHDRFWIANQNKSLVMGTSINGFGNKLALVDILDSVDLADLLADLRANSLI